MPGPPDNDDLEPTAHRVNDILAQFFRDDQGAMLTKWTLQAEVIDPDGTGAMWTLSLPGMAAWERLGFYRYAAVHQEALVAESIRRGDGSD